MEGLPLKKIAISKTKENTQSSSETLSVYCTNEENKICTKLACAALLQNRQEFESDLPPQNPSKFHQVVKILRKKSLIGSSAFFIEEIF